MTKKHIKHLRTWIRALRGGKYRQTRGQLHGIRGHCCLGVADICSGTILARERREYYGLNFTEELSLISLNDKGHKNFSYIADWIENNIIPRAKKEQNT